MENAFYVCKKNTTKEIKVAILCSLAKLVAQNILFPINFAF